MPTEHSAMQIDQEAIDEGLYSRQLYVLGHEAMKRMASSNVLVVGMQGLGVEIAKNVCLAGVKSVAVYDPELVTVQDLGAQYFLREEDIGKSRAEASAPRLAELNNYVPVLTLAGNTGQQIKGDMLEGFQVVVLTNTSWATQTEINDWTHQHDIAFIAAETRGLFGSVFNDFGPNFTCIDTTGEQPLSGMIVSISKDIEGIVTCLDETRHGLEDGDYVTFSEIQGMDSLNGCVPRKVSVKGPYTFAIGDTTSIGEYRTGGIFTQVKIPKVIQFKPLRESILQPDIFTADFAKFERPTTLHVGFQALSSFHDRHGYFPRPQHPTDSAEVISIAKALSAENLSERLLESLAHQASGELSPMNAVIGGFVAQEVLKACSAKFHPLVQHLYFDSLESMPTVAPQPDECAPTNTRYDRQVAVFGVKFQARIANHRQFLVGSGAIGCELLKNWGMMGLGSGERGLIHVTDLDTIEKSNLNRQFLFRPKDLGKFKSEAAAAAVADMNPDMTGKIIPRQEPVGPDTENIYGDQFYASIDGVTNALDNVKARLYMDQRCVFYKKPLLESGTLGTKGNVQVIIPNLTESYASSQDPPEKETPMCTVKNFPNAINHCIEWSRAYFDNLFVKPAQAANSYLSEPNFVESTLKYSGDAATQLRQIMDFLVDEKPLTFEECIVWARKQFEESYNNSIRQLLFSLPKDHLTSTGQPFWSGPKRAPDPLTFDSSNAQHMDFIVAAANLHAFNYGLRGETDLSVFTKVVDTVRLPSFEPKSGVKIQINDNDPSPELGGASDLSDITKKLPPPSTMAGYRMVPVEFEKDDDANHHIDFITASANLRALNYNIPTADRHKTKQVAGKIIPAIATTTAVVAGLVCLELYKVIDDKMKLEEYTNGYLNLALPFFGFSDPIAAPKHKYSDIEWTLWDRFDFRGDPTLKSIIDWFEETHSLEISMVSQGVSMLWSQFMPKKKGEERLSMKMSALVEQVSRKAIPPHVKQLLVEVVASDKEGEDVEVPSLVVEI